MSNGDSFLSRSTAASKETVKWEDGNEYPVIKLEISNTSHPFYTGKNVLVDTAGRIDKFRKRYERKIIRLPSNDPPLIPEDFLPDNEYFRLMTIILDDISTSGNLFPSDRSVVSPTSVSVLTILERWQLFFRHVVLASESPVTHGKHSLSLPTLCLRTIC